MAGGLLAHPKLRCPSAQHLSLPLHSVWVSVRACNRTTLVSPEGSSRGSHLGTGCLPRLGGGPTWPLASREHWVVLLPLLHCLIPSPLDWYSAQSTSKSRTPQVPLRSQLTLLLSEGGGEGREQLSLTRNCCTSPDCSGSPSIQHGFKPTWSSPSLWKESTKTGGAVFLARAMAPLAGWKILRSCLPGHLGLPSLP